MLGSGDYTDVVIKYKNVGGEGTHGYKYRDSPETHERESRAGGRSTAGRESQVYFKPMYKTESV